jgi:hypothetical protein
MSDQHEIQHLKNQDIDYEKWDFCIQQAENGNLYARSWYLDVVSPSWEALVLGDYKFVMPLPVVRKLGIKMVSQPLHCQQLGIFPVPKPKIQQQFSNKLWKLFRLVRYQLNVAMQVGAFENFGKQKKQNYVLNLDLPYSEVSKGFTTHAKRNLKAAEKAEVTVVKGLQPVEFFAGKRQAENRKIPEKSYWILHRLVAQTLTRGSGVIYAAYSRTNNLCAAAFIIFNQNRAYYLNAYSTDEGRDNRAMYAIVNELVKEFSGSGTVIDFEGSIIEGVARFYEGFGAQVEHYYFLGSNRFPFNLKKF